MIFAVLLQGVFPVHASLEDRNSFSNQGQTPSSNLFQTLVFYDAQGKEHTLAEWAKSHHDTPILCVAWATYCGPCMKELPVLQALQKEMGNQVSILPIAIEAPTSGHAYAINGISMPLFYSPSFSEFLGKMNVNGIPFLCLFSSKGELLFKQSGAATLEELKEEIHKALALQRPEYHKETK